MSYISRLLYIVCLIFFVSCTHQISSKISPKIQNNIFLSKIRVQVGENTHKSTSFRIGELYITTSHSVQSDFSTVNIQGEKKCRVVQRNRLKDIAWIFCGNTYSGEFPLPSTPNPGENIQVGVLRNKKIVTKVGSIIDPSAQVRGINFNGNIYTLSGIVLTDIKFEAGDSGAPIFSLEDGRWVGIVHTQ